MNQGTNTTSRIDASFQSTSAYSGSWRIEQSANSGSTYCPQDLLQASGQLQTRATGSFVDISREVVGGSIAEWNTVEQTSGLSRVRRPHTDPIGQVTPVGDALFPLLLFAALYALGKGVKRYRLR